MAAIAFGSIAVVSAFCFAIALAALLAPMAGKRIFGTEQTSDNMSVRLINGIPMLYKFSERMLKLHHVQAVVNQAVEVLVRRSVETDAKRLLSFALACFAALAVASGFLAGNVVAAIAVPSCATAAAMLAVGNDQARYREAARDAVPAALESMAACFASGYTLVQTFNQVAKDLSGPLSGTFSRCAHILEMGGSAPQALAELRRGSCARELAFVAVALDVQHQSGGAMRQVLEAASDSVRDELELKRTLRVQTAQAQLSARVVSIMPLVLVAAFSLASPGFLSPFFESLAGIALLALAVLMQLAGIVLVKRALAVEGVS